MSPGARACGHSILPRQPGLRTYSRAPEIFPLLLAPAQCKSTQTTAGTTGDSQNLTRGRQSRTANREKVSDQGAGRSPAGPGDWPAAGPLSHVTATTLPGLLPHLSTGDLGRPPSRGRAMGGDGDLGIKERFARSRAACAGVAVSPQRNFAGGRAAGARVWQPGA